MGIIEKIQAIEHSRDAWMAKAKCRRLALSEAEIKVEKLERACAELKTDSYVHIIQAQSWKIQAQSWKAKHKLLLRQMADERRAVKNLRDAQNAADRR